MIFSWLFRGLRTGVVTTRYPRRLDSAATILRGAPVVDAERCRRDGCRTCIESCLPVALSTDVDGMLQIDYGACIACGLCVAACPEGAITMSTQVELAVRSRDDLRRNPTHV